MTNHNKVLRATAFASLASLYPDLHGLTMNPEQVDEVLLRAAEELSKLRKSSGDCEHLNTVDPYSSMVHQRTLWCSDCGALRLPGRKDWVSPSTEWRGEPLAPEVPCAHCNDPARADGLLLLYPDKSVFGRICARCLGSTTLIPIQ